MKILYQGYSTLSKNIQTEKATISYLDTANKTTYLKMFESGKITMEEIVRKNHKDGLMYEVTVLDNLDMPINYLAIVHENDFIGISFLDDAGREYLKYHFDEVESKKKLFLEEVWYRKYSGDKDEMDYYIHFVFDKEGNVAYRKYDEINKKIIDFESNRPFDVRGLYEDYPEFGEYENLIKSERNIDILDDFIK